MRLISKIYYGSITRCANMTDFLLLSVCHAARYTHINHTWAAWSDSRRKLLHTNDLRGPGPAKALVINNLHGLAGSVPTYGAWQAIRGMVAGLARQLLQKKYNHTKKSFAFHAVCDTLEP